jgi:DNA-binding XRE family transcriptional regulator
MITTVHEAIDKYWDALEEDPSQIAVVPGRDITSFDTSLARVVRGRTSNRPTLLVMARFAFDGLELKRRRREAGLTQAELARQVGRSHASLTHYESGFTVPPTAALLRVCEVLQVEPGSLFTAVPEKEDVPEAVMMASTKRHRDQWSRCLPQ